MMRPKLPVGEPEKAARGTCDLCHNARGVRFADYYWVCFNCARRYLHWLEVTER